VTLVVVTILIVAWGWWGVVTWRDRRQSMGGRVNSISAFSNHLSVLERSSPAARGLVASNSSMSDARVPHRSPSGSAFAAGSEATGRLRALVTGSPGESLRSPASRPAPRTLTLGQAQQRRRQMVFGLGGTALFFTLLALIAGGRFVTLALLASLATAGYLGLLVHARSLEIERATKVRSIASARAGTDVLAAWDERITGGIAHVDGQSYGHDHRRHAAPAYAMSDDYGTGADLEPALAGVAN
jgi:hypothetical protein